MKNSITAILMIVIMVMTKKNVTLKGNGSPLWIRFECIKYSIAIALLSGCFISICNTIILFSLITIARDCPEKFLNRNGTGEISNNTYLTACVSGCFLRFCSLANIYFAFGWQIIADLQLIVWNLVGSFLDTIFRLYFIVFNVYSDL